MMFIKMMKVRISRQNETFDQYFGTVFEIPLLINCKRTEVAALLCKCNLALLKDGDSSPITKAKNNPKELLKLASNHISDWNRLLERYCKEPAGSPAFNPISINNHSRVVRRVTPRLVRMALVILLGYVGIAASWSGMN